MLTNRDVLCAKTVAALLSVSLQLKEIYQRRREYVIIVQLSVICFVFYYYLYFVFLRVVDGGKERSQK